MRIRHQYATRMAFAFVAIACLCGTACAADTIQMDGQAKHTIGTITELQSGDVACYLLMKDDKGADFTEMGDYDICDRSPTLTGKTVRLTYEMSRVMADSCQGDPECRESKTVPFVVSVEILQTGAPAPQ